MVSMAQRSNLKYKSLLEVVLHVQETLYIKYLSALYFDNFSWSTIQNGSWLERPIETSSIVLYKLVTQQV